MQFAYGIAFAALMLAVATLPVFFLVGELFPRIYSRTWCAVTVWLLMVLGTTALGALVYMRLADCPDCW